MAEANKKEAGYVVKLQLFLPVDPKNPAAMAKAAAATEKLSSVEGLGEVAGVEGLRIEDAKVEYVSRRNRD